MSEDNTEEVQFLEDLKQEINNYKTLKENLDYYKKAVDEKKEQFKKWLQTNNVDYFEVEDLDGQLWKLDHSQERNSLGIKSWDALHTYLTEDQWDEVVRVSNSNPFTVQPLKQSKNSK